MSTTAPENPTPTVADEAERLLSYWHQHGNDPDAVTKWAMQDLLAFVRLVAPEAADHYGEAPWLRDTTPEDRAEDARGPLFATRLPADLDGDSLVVLPAGMDVPGACDDDDVNAVALIDLARHIVEQYEDRDERTVWRLTAADLDAHAGRTLTDDELSTVAVCLDNSTVGDCIAGAIDQLPAAEDDDADPIPVDSVAGTLAGILPPTVDQWVSENR